MKTLLKSLMVLGVVIATAAGAASAYFTTTVTAADNLITTGTIRLALASSAKHDAPGSIGYWLAYDLDGVSTDVANFEDWTNAEPGAPASYVNNPSGVDTFAAGNTSRWVAVANNGTLDEQYRFNTAATGRWTSIPRAADTSLATTDSTGLTLCRDVMDADGTGSDATLVSVTNMYRFANGGTAPACLNQEECQNVRNWLTANSYTAIASSPAGDLTPVAGYLDESGFVTLAPNEFQIYRVDLNLSSTTNNCYQDATYTYDMTVNGKQVGGTY